MASRLAGQVAIVTGASKGIGAAIARRLAADGASVIVNYSSSKAGAEKVVAEITGAGGKAVAVQANIANEAETKRLFAEAARAFGRVTILVNNAGVYEFKPLEEVTPELFHRMFDLNVLGLLLATREAVKQFGPEGGNIINIGSVAATAAPALGSVYSATKGGGGHDHQVACEGARAAKDPGELGQSGDGGDGRDAGPGDHEQRLGEANRGSDAAAADRAAGGHRAGGGVHRFGGVGVDHGGRL